MPREFQGQAELHDYAERNCLEYAWEYTPAFAKRQRLLSPEQYEIVEVRHLSWRESGDTVLEGHHAGRVGGECTATRSDGYHAGAIAGPEGEAGSRAGGQAAAQQVRNASAIKRERSRAQRAESIARPSSRAGAAVHMPGAGPASRRPHPW